MGGGGQNSGREARSSRSDAVFPYTGGGIHAAMKLREDDLRDPSMSSRIRAWLFPLTLAIAAVGGVSASQEQLLAEPAKFDNAYRDGDYGRVRDADAGVTILRAEWDRERDQSDSAGLSSPVFPGDALFQATGSMAIHSRRPSCFLSSSVRSEEIARRSLVRTVLTGTPMRWAICLGGRFFQ